jgi:hypothetical protein
VISYFSKTESGISTYDTLFQYTEINQSLPESSLMTVPNLLNGYLYDYAKAYFPSEMPSSSNTTFQDAIDYVITLVDLGYFKSQSSKDFKKWKDYTLDTHWYIYGDVVIPDGKNLTINEGYVLVINGSLTMGEQSTLSGNVIVTRNFTIDGKSSKWETFEGTVYVKGNFQSASKLILGSKARPSFVFSIGEVKLGSKTQGYGYFLTSQFDIDSSNRNNNVYVIGGIYSTGSITYPSNGLHQNSDLQYDVTSFFNYGVTPMLGSSGSSSSNIIYTGPKKE